MPRRFCTHKGNEEKKLKIALTYPRENHFKSSAIHLDVTLSLAETLMNIAQTISNGMMQ